jgi:2-deoxy-D-gluconate 3-dehydrogenase
MNVLEMFSLRGKTALVTGCRRGIGKAMTIALAEAGADIAGVSASLESSGSDVELAVRALGRSFTGYACDFADRTALYGWIEQVSSDLPVVDILVNNAGAVFRSPAAEFPDDAWDRLVEINLSAQFIISRELGKRMIARGSGKIIYTASLLAFQGGILVPAYAASKAGVVAMMKGLANEWAPFGVHVNAIVPGYVETDVTAALREDPQRSRELLDRIPAGRWGGADDYKGAVVFLASAASEYMTGSTIIVDGGWMAR